MAGPLVVLQTLSQSAVIILHETPVQNHLQLAWQFVGRKEKPAVRSCPRPATRISLSR